jgi:YfiH family protein
MSETIALAFGSGDSFAEIPLGPAGGAFRAGISLARAGDMSLARRRELACRARLLSAIGWPPEKAFAVTQVHSRRILVADGRDPADMVEEQADGLVSSRGDALLTMTVADCLPIFLADPETGAFALVHSGWRGTGIAAEALNRMESSLGTRRERVSAVIGPGIGPCCYSVPEERYAAFLSGFGESAAIRGGGGRFFVDLRRANQLLLERAGVSWVGVVGDCTACTPALGSFRRQGPRDFTRMLAFIGRRPAPR